MNWTPRQHWTPSDICRKLDAMSSTAIVGTTSAWTLITPIDLFLSHLATTSESQTVA